MTFHVGQKVVFIAGACKNAIQGEEVPVKGVVYTVRETGIAADSLRDKRQLLRLAEIVNCIRRYNGGYTEAWFNSKSFRPVVTTDISVFTAMLAPVKEDA